LDCHSAPVERAVSLFFSCFISGTAGRLFHRNPVLTLGSPFVLLDGIMTAEAQEFAFRIEMWNDGDTGVEDVIALVRDHAVARAAFAEAVQRRPGKVIILRQKSRVLADSRR
jgi:hypothetical protein